MFKDMALRPEQVLDLLLDTVMVVDAHGRVMYASASCEQTFGYTQDELRGMYMVELIHPEDRGMTLQAAWQIMAGEPRIGFRNRYLRKDGRVVHLEWAAQWSETHEARIAVARRLHIEGEAPRQA